MACLGGAAVTFLADEASVQDSDPRELISIEINPPYGLVWHHTSGTEDLEVDDTVYRAIAIDRGELKTPVPEENAETHLFLPIDHPLVRRYSKQGVPPDRVRVTMRRLQVRSGDVRQLWYGFAEGMEVDDAIAKFLIPSDAMTRLKRMLPMLTARRACPHILYGEAGCLLSRAGATPDDVLPFKLTTTATFVAGRDVRVDLSNVPAANTWRSGWARFGEFVHVSSGTRRSIAAQTDLNPGVSTVTELQMYERIVELKAGDTVEVYAGCDHTVDTCRDKFANQLNYGGAPALPSKNPFRTKAAGSFDEDQ